MKLKKEKIIQDYTDDKIKVIDDRVYNKEKRNNDYMISLNTLHYYGWKW